MSNQIVPRDGALRTRTTLAQALGCGTHEGKQVGADRREFSAMARAVGSRLGVVI
jgi:hypothetical protein